MKLDEQCFQKVLLAVFTVQEYNRRQLANDTLPSGSVADVYGRVPGLYHQSHETVEAEEPKEKIKPSYERATNAGDQLHHSVSRFGAQRLNITEGEGEAAEWMADSLRAKAKATGKRTNDCMPRLDGQCLNIIEVEDVGEELAELTFDGTREKDKREHQTVYVLGQAQEQPLFTTELPVAEAGIHDHVLRDAVQQALNATHASCAAIALAHQGKLICLDAAGERAAEIGLMIGRGSGFTGACASSGAMQFCANTMLDRRRDADVCQKLGARAVVVMPFFHQDQFLGLIAVFARRPYAFGTREVLALQGVLGKLMATLRPSAEAANVNDSRDCDFPFRTSYRPDSKRKFVH